MSEGSRPLAVVTGASSGIGRELARRAAHDGYDLVVVARRGDRLVELATELSATASVTPVVADLATTEGVDALLTVLGDRQVEILVDNAGVGGRGRFAVERDLQADLDMVALDVTAVVRLTGALLPGMLDRGHGRILIVGSIAGYLPGPGQAVYHASKAFVRAFGLALAEETRETGVHVTVLSPGPVATEFAAAAGYPEGEVHASPLMPMVPATDVARVGWEALMAGRPEVIPDLSTRIGLQALRFLPWRLVARSAGPSRQAGTPRWLPRPQDYSAPVAYRPPAGWYRRLNHLGVPLTSLGWAPQGAVTLEVRGRRTGKPRRVPILVTEHEGAEYLVALAGEAQWLRNVRAADGYAVLRRRKARPVRLHELPVEERPPVLAAYIEAARRRSGPETADVAIRRYFGVDHPGPEDLTRIAPRYPVLRAEPVQLG
jgi:deazaflavin-dependent oxidoreductase (nitroreductase family)